MLKIGCLLQKSGFVDSKLLSNLANTQEASEEVYKFQIQRALSDLVCNFCKEPIHLKDFLSVNDWKMIEKSAVYNQEGKSLFTKLSALHGFQSKLDNVTYIRPKSKVLKVLKSTHQSFL